MVSRIRWVGGESAGHHGFANAPTIVSRLEGMTENPFDRLQDVIGYRFRSPQLLLEALTHSSYAQEAPGGCRDNEQLEFLGDAVLNFLVSVALVNAFPEWEEGKLTRARSRLVAAAHLSRVGARLELGTYLRLGRGEEKTGGRNKSALFVNALEALVAALFRWRAAGGRWVRRALYSPGGFGRVRGRVVFGRL